MMPITSMLFRRNETAAVEITALAAGAGPPAKRIAARLIGSLGRAGSDEGAKRSSLGSKGSAKVGRQDDCKSTRPTPHRVDGSAQKLAGGRTVNDPVGRRRGGSAWGRSVHDRNRPMMTFTKHFVQGPLYFARSKERA